MLLEGGKDVPTPLAVDGVFRRPVQVEQTLHSFRPMYVVSVVVLLRTRCTNHCLITVNVTLRAGFTNTGQIVGLLNSSYF